MKKLISVLLVLAMLCSMSTLLSSCSAISEGDLQNNAQAVIAEAFELAYADFFDTDTGVSDVAARAQKGGMVHFSLSGKTLLGEKLNKIEASTYLAKDGERAVFDALVNYDGEDLSLRTFLDKERLTLVSEDVFGSNAQYMLDFSTLLTDVDNSALLEMMGMSEEDLAGLKDAISTIEGYSGGTAKTEEELARIYNDVLATMLPAIATEELTIGAGTVSCITVTYTLNNTTIKNAVKLFVERIFPDTNERAEMLASLEEELSEENTAYNMSLKLYINKESGAMVKAVISGDTVVTNAYMGDNSGEDYSERTTGTIEIVLGATEIALTSNSKTSAWYLDEDTTTAVTLKLKKNDSGDRVVYDLTCSGEENGETQEPLSASLTYQKASGDFVLSVSAKGSDGKTQTVTLNGKVTVSKDEAVIAVHSVSMDDVTISFQLSLTFRAEAVTPAAPENAKNILTMSEADVEAFFEDFSESNLYQLIADLNS